MSATLKILLVEDSANDAELVLRELKRAGMGCTGLRVDTEPEYQRALSDFLPHVILSDFSMPRFDGMTALAIAREKQPDVPFIFVSGTLGEEYAIRALKSGATDYVLKSNLMRLPPTVERAILDARTVAERKLAELKVRRLNRVYAVLSGINALTVRVRNPDELFRGACRIAVEAGQFRLAWVGLVDQAAMVVRPVAWHGDADNYVELMPLGLCRDDPASYGVTGQACHSGAPIIIEDMQADPQVLQKELCKSRGFESLAVLPLQVGSEVVGALSLYAAEAGFFDAEEMKLLIELAGAVAFALDYIDKADKLSQLAYLDTLTGLPNRRLLMDRLRRAQLNSTRQRTPYAVLFIDLDDFKRVNDLYGHDTGDKLLVEVAKRLQAAVRQNDTVARLGGDEFVVILEDLGPTEEIASIHVDGIAKKILDLLAHEHLLDAERHYCSASVGIEIFSGSDRSVEQILKEADAAMYRDKRARRPG